MNKGGYLSGSQSSSTAGRLTAGFTIVETLIVLAVTSAMFIAAALAISGKQAKTEFTTAINGARQQIQQIINETASGYYPNAGNFSCNGTSRPVSFTASSGGQGSNTGCVFLGKALQFGSDTNSSQLTVLPITGNQYDATGNPIQKLSDALPRAVYPANSSETAIPTSSAETHLLQYGLAVADANNAGCPGLNTGVCYTTTATAPTNPNTTSSTGTLAFLAGDSSGTIAAAASFGLQSGAPVMTLYGVSGSQPNQSAQAATDKIGNVASNATGLQPADKASICLVSGGGNQSGLITITGGLQVSLVIYEDKQC